MPLLKRVVADNRVLHRVRQHQQDDQIERVELRQLALAADAEDEDEGEVDDGRPQDLLGPGDLQPRAREDLRPRLELHGP